FSIALKLRFKWTGAMVDLVDGIQASEECLNLAPADWPQRPACLNILANCLGSRFIHTGSRADLDRYIAVYNECISAVPAAGQARGAILNNLAEALMNRSELRETDDPSDLDLAIAMCEEAKNFTSEG